MFHLHFTTISFTKAGNWKMDACALNIRANKMVLSGEQS